MSKVTYRKEGNIAILGIDRPEALNALSREIVDDIGSTIEQIKSDEEVRILLIYSEKNFAAGADIGDMVECNETEAREFVFSPVFNEIEDLSIPTIAAIEGFALGGGLELALTCDIRFASEKAKMGFPEINLGIMPGAGGTVRTPRIIGESAAKDMIFSGIIVNADHALQLGLVNHVAEEGHLYEEALAYAGKLADKAPIALKTAKETIDRGLEVSEKTGIDMECNNWASLFNTEDQKAGMRAFLKKEKPEYKGR